MVLNRQDKRKRKEGDLVDLMDPLSESPKRTKVHAQRKFAQGTATLFNPTHTPVKDKEKIKPPVITELITHKRPNTEDFLTFLCFRGTSILPPSLNFFNVDLKKEKSNGSVSTCKPSDSTVPTPTVPAGKQALDVSEKSTSNVKSVVLEKKKAQETVQKNLLKSAASSKLKSATSTMQALRKKYQEQRLAKQRIKKKFKKSCVMRTRSCTERSLLKSECVLAPRKFLPRFETKRHGLRSGSFIDKSKKVPSQAKSVVMKSKKKIPIKEKESDSSTDTSESEEEEEDEEEEEEEEEEDEDEDAEDEEEKPIPQEKSTSQTKRVIQKSLPKKICTRSKSEMRRITRSHSEKVSLQSLPRRPSRKTKEAAAVYMEILGRKLVSPDLENEDNLSVDSFPELPNARRITQTENEIKAKLKQPSKTATKGKDSKLSSNSNEKRQDKSKPSKLALKSKRLIRVQRYCESDSEEGSVSSTGTGNNTGPITRKSLEKVDKPSSRSLRSSSRNAVKQTVKSDTQNALNTRSKSQMQISVKSSKETSIMKRKRDQSNNKVVPTKANPVKQKKTKNTENQDTESDEETLGMMLNKLKKKKGPSEEKKVVCSDKNKTKDPPNQNTDSPSPKLDLPRVSDDEESFHGFTKKAISKVLDTFQTRANVNFLHAEEIDMKSNVNKKPMKVENDVDTKQTDTGYLNLLNESTLLSENLPSHTNIKSITDQKTQDLSNVIKTRLSPIIVPEKKCSHEDEIHSKSIVDVPLPGLHARKERVNMSTEQIEKWLNESTLAKEQSKVEIETISPYKYETLVSPTTIVTEKIKMDTSHLSIPTKIQHLVRPVNVMLSKLHEKVNLRDRPLTLSKSTPTLVSELMAINLRQAGITLAKNKAIEGNKEEQAPVKKDQLSGDDNDIIPKSEQTWTEDLKEKRSSPEKKVTCQQKKPFLPKVKERKVVTPNANAFSPENESSVYAFESDTEVPVNTPFRRKVKDPTNLSAVLQISEQKSVKTDTDSTAGDNDGKQGCDKEEKTLKSPVASIGLSLNNTNEIRDANNLPTLNINKFELPMNFGNLGNVQVLPLDKLTTSWTNVNCSASIAVQVNLDDRVNSTPETPQEDASQQKSTEISTQTENSNENDDDNDGQLFYIPLQAIARNPSNLAQGQQLIQGVAVKLGTDGPSGPNQRVLLRAKLVTKSPVSVPRCPPIGTVQPTTRALPPPNINENEQSGPSTSAARPPVPLAPKPPESRMSSPQKSESVCSSPSRPTNVQNISSGIDKLMKSPKTSKERKQSTDSIKSGKRSQSKVKQKANDHCAPSNCTTFPSVKSINKEARLVEAPTFHPTEKDFQDPLEYIDKIRPIAEKFGICKVVPPANFKPECKVSDDMRFTAYNQYVHRMLHRWGPNVKEMMAIKKYLATQSITLTHPPWIGGMEVDLPHLYQTVQSLGGLKEVIEKKKWQKVADGMKIPKSAQDRVTKLDDIYCKYLLPYDTLSPEEREKLFDEVEAEWVKKESRTLQRQDAVPNENDDEEEDDSSDEIEECIVKGRNMPLNAFYRIARNTQRMWFGENQRSGNEAEGASANDVETAFWKHVAERKRHVCVHAASIDSSGRGFGFSVAKNSPFARHPWNLKVLTNNAGSVLRALGPLMGVTVPTLHVGMLFSACCWYRDPHGLPWIEYLHTGAKKIWYGIPDEYSNNFREALSKMVPQYCKNKTIWLPSDTAMVPPELLVNNGVPLCQTVQEPGQFIIVFPKAFTSSICTGYVVSESVYFAQASWLETAEQVFKDIQDSCEPSIFSFERLLFNIINDSRSHVDVLKQILTSAKRIRDKEIDCRKQLHDIGLTNTERLPLPDSGKRRKGKKIKEDDGDFECEVCRANLFVSLVNNSQDDSVYCLSHALQLINKTKQVLKHCTLMYTYSEDELDDMIHKLQDRIEAKSKKTNQIKQTK